MTIQKIITRITVLSKKNNTTERTKIADRDDCYSKEDNNTIEGMYNARREQSIMHKRRRCSLTMVPPIQSGATRREERRRTTRRALVVVQEAVMGIFDSEVLPFFF